MPSRKGKPNLTPKDKAKIRRDKADGYTNREIAARNNVSDSTVENVLYGRDARPANGQEWAKAKAEEKIPEPLEHRELSPEAARALAPFGWEEWTDEVHEELTQAFLYWRVRYTGHVSMPWQVEASRTLIRWWFSPDRAWGVFNCAPGSGKTTLATDLAIWLICRDRRIRVLFGARSSSLASKNSNRARRLLERTTPVRAKPEDVARGMAVDAVACLPLDYGRFKPEGYADTWRKDEFVVVQADSTPIDEKEPTGSSFGFEQEYLGHRFDLAIWDDVDNTQTLRSLEIVENNRRIFDDEIESRMDDGGLLVVCQQRLARHDISGHCLAKTLIPDDEDDEGEGPPKYERIVFRAHDEDACTEQHGRNAPPQGKGGCLLDPQRLSWKDLRAVMRDRRKYSIVYQQDEADPEGVLVNPLWITGGSGEHGELHPGCWDHDRAAWTRPQTDQDLLSVISLDPSSGAGQWGLTWWAVDREHGFRYLIGLKKHKLQASDILDFNPQSREYTGLLVDWMEVGKRIGLPFTNWVVEKNASNRWIYKYRFYELWCQINGVEIIEHNSDRNTADPERGIEATLPAVYRAGLVRLPGLGSSRGLSMRLVDEVTHYVPGEGRKRYQTDLTMSQWFVEYKLPDLIGPKHLDIRLDVPSWLSSTSAFSLQGAA